MADNTNNKPNTDTIDTSHSPQVQHLIDTLQGEHIGKEGGQSAIIFRMVMPDHLCPFGLKSIDALKHAG
ncbi:hypothetical protein R0K04_22415, partial [Pseudoalteromonas sp. SIMBA_153]